jgi:curved DNA-binding protein CbpA
MNPYEELGVPPDASVDQINAAFRRKAREAHPDAGGDAETMARLSRAVAILRDPEARSRFDQTGATEEPGHSQQTRVVELLVGAFQQALMQVLDPSYEDIIAHAKGQIREVIQQCNQQTANGKQQRARFEKAIKRLKHKGEGQNFIRNAMEANVAAVDRALAQLAEQRTVAEEALSLADEYDWERDTPPAPPMQGGFFHTMNRSTYTGSTF